MLMGPAHVPLTLMTRLGKALAATIASDSPRAQLTVMAGLNCAESEEVRHRIETIDARKSLVGVRMDCLLVGNGEVQRNGDSSHWPRAFRPPNRPGDSFSCSQQRHYPTNPLMRSRNL